MNRALIPFLTTSMMTPAERTVGRFLRAPDHPTGGDGGTAPAGDSGTPPDNQGGNLGDSGNNNPGGDNAGAADPLKGFWDSKPEAPASAESDPASAQESAALGTQLRSQIDAFAPPPVFTDDIAKQVAEGNFDGINTAIATAHKAAIQQSIGVTAKLLEAVIGKIQGDIDNRINSALGNKESESFLGDNFPQAKDPAFAPTVKRIWDQSLVNTKGNREEAIRMTRGMLQAMGKEFAPDDIREAAHDPHAGINTAASKSLVADLLSRT